MSIDLNTGGADGPTRPHRAPQARGSYEPRHAGGAQGPRTLPLTQASQVAQTAQAVHDTQVLPEVEEGEGAPVFVDGSGRRARGVRIAGALAGAGLTVYLAVVGVNLATGAEVPLTPWPAGKPTGTGPDGTPRTGTTPHRPAGPGASGNPRNGGVPNAGTPSLGSGNDQSRPSASTAPSAPVTTPVPATTRPGKSQATPPAYGKKKKDQSG
ncbi:hypothetical protein [Spirillospora sp. NPDC047279]|uniref:hypothetical protein n=1 Tax=Spirillospora sp. NPDC047279 TaxID=3155478 RepID=UPI0033C67358